MISSFISSLKECARRKDLRRGIDLHADLCHRGLLKKNLYLGNTVVSMYAKCGALEVAQRVLDELPFRDVVSWNALIGGYAKYGYAKEALECFHLMQNEGLSPDAFTYACVIKACAVMRDASTGEKIHDEIVRQGLLKDDVVLGTSLVDMYAKCGALAKAQEVMNKLTVRDAVSWNALIAGYSQQNEGLKALECFHCMQKDGFSPDAITYACILKACGITEKIDTGKQIHEDIVSRGLLEKNVVLGNALLFMYAKCGLLGKAEDVIHQIQARNVISWSILIAAYAEKARVEEAFGCFQHMKSEDLHPNAMTYASILKACSNAYDCELGSNIHKEIAGKRLYEKDVVVCSTLIEMYAKCGLLSKAQEVFNGIPFRDSALWSALVAGYAHQGQGQEVLRCLEQMRNEGFFPDAITYACILKVCSTTSEPDVGKQIHDEIIYQRLLEKDQILGNALVNLYAKCGAFTKAQKVIDDLPVRDVCAWNILMAGFAQEGFGDKAQASFWHMCIEGLSPNAFSWNALIGAYAQQGQVETVLSFFEWMQQEGILPNKITYLIVLYACVHAGLVEEGQMYFENMKEIHGIRPDREHLTCMVDLFGRAQCFEKAMKLIEEMPFDDYPPVWFALIGACTQWGHVNLGKFAFTSLLQLKVYNAVAFISMANVYAAAGMQQEAQKIDDMRIRENGIQPANAGCKSKNWFP